MENQNKIINKVVLRPDEVAGILQVDLRTIYRMVAEGELEKFPIKRRVIRIKGESLRQLLASEA